jgi:hypothetical protein
VDDGADSVACDPSTDRDFNRAAPHLADPIKCHMSTQRTQAPDDVVQRSNRAAILDPLENNIGAKRTLTKEAISEKCPRGRRGPTPALMASTKRDVTTVTRLPDIEMVS